MIKPPYSCGFSPWALRILRNPGHRRPRDRVTRCQVMGCRREFQGPRRHIRVASLAIRYLNYVRALRCSLQRLGNCWNGARDEFIDDIEFWRMSVKRTIEKCREKY